MTDDPRRQAFQDKLNQRLREAEYEPPLPEGFHERLKARLDRVSTTTPQRRPYGRWLAGLAVAACLLLLVLKAPKRNEPLVADMVNHHVTCWGIANSPGREAHFQEWMKEHGNRPLPASANLKEADRRNCPVGEDARGPHLMYRDPQGREVSLYLLPPGTARAPAGMHSFEEFNLLVWEKEGWLCAMVSHSDEATMRSWLTPGSAVLIPEQGIDMAGWGTRWVSDVTRPFRAGGPGPRGSAVSLCAAAGGES